MKYNSDIVLNYLRITMETSSKLKKKVDSHSNYYALIMNFILVCFSQTLFVSFVVTN